MQGSGDLIGCGGGRGGNEQHLFLAGAFLGSTTTEIVYLGTFSQPARNQGRQSTFRERVSIQGAPAQSHPKNLFSTICTISSQQSPQSAQSHCGRIWKSRSRKANRGEERRQDRGNVCQGYSLSLLGMIVKPSCESCPTQVSWQVKFLSIMFCLSVLPVLSVLSALSVLSVISVLSFLYFLSV